MKKNLDFLKRNLIAHRGLHNKDNPENSIGAFKKAIQENYIIELDVHLTKDKEIIVFHDNNLKRMTGIDKKINLCKKSELEKLYLNSTKYTIPTLKTVLELVNGKVPILIEIKYDNKVGTLEKKLTELLDNYKGEIAIQSFRISTIIWFRLKRPNYIRGLLIPYTTEEFNQFLNKNWLIKKICNLDFFSCNYKYSCQEKIRKLREKNLFLGWTIKTKEDYINYKDCFDNLICENIEEINEVIKNDRYRHSKKM